MEIILFVAFVAMVICLLSVMTVVVCGALDATWLIEFIVIVTCTNSDKFTTYILWF